MTINLIDTFIRDDGIVPPESLVEHLVIHSDHSSLQCKIFLIVYLQSLKIYLTGKNAAFFIKGLKIRPEAKEPYRIIGK